MSKTVQRLLVYVKDSNFYFLYQRHYSVNLFRSKTTFIFLSQAVAKKASVLRRRRSKGSIFSINVSEWKHVQYT